MTVEEFLKEQEKSLAKEAQAREERERVFIEAKCKELGCKRVAKCIDCGKYVASEENLPFFESRNGLYDIYYCGCKGWN